VVAALLAGLGVGRVRRPVDRTVANRNGTAQPPAVVPPGRAGVPAVERGPFDPPANLDEALAGLGAGLPARWVALDWLAKARPDAPRRGEVVAALEAQLRGAPLPGVRERAAAALAAWAGPDEVPALVALLVDPAPEVRNEAIEALARLRDPRAVDPLAARLADPVDREAAGRALAGLGAQARATLVSLLRASDAGVRGAARSVLERTGGLEPGAEVEAGLADLADPATSPTGRCLALTRLGRLAPEAAAGRQARVAAAVGRFTDDPDSHVRASAVHALSVWATLASVPTLLRVLEAAEPDLLRQALVALAKFEVDDPKVVEALARHMADPADRPHAAQALRAVGSGAEDALLRLLRSRDARVRLEACHTLRIVGTRKCLPALAKLATDPDRELAHAARLAHDAVSRAENAGKAVRRKGRS
jgi:HEAT repeat protein